MDLSVVGTDATNRRFAGAIDSRDKVTTTMGGTGALAHGVTVDFEKRYGEATEQR